MYALAAMLTSLFLLFAFIPPSQMADHIVVSKSHHTMTLLAHGQVIKTYRIAIGPAEGRKERQGDHKTPEGHYVIDAHNPHSTYHLSLHVSYPNGADRARAGAAHVPPGGDIMIHGLPAGTRALGPLQFMADWTDGCIAVSDAEIEEIYRLVPNGTPVDIGP